MKARNYTPYGTVDCSLCILKFSYSPVHDSVHGEVEPDDPSIECGVLLVGKNTVVESEYVMVPMQEHERSFAEHNEDRISELGQLRQHK